MDDHTVWIAWHQVDGHDQPELIGVYVSEHLADAACAGHWKRENGDVPMMKDWYGVKPERVRRSVAY